LDLSGSEQGQVMGSCGYGKSTSGSINGKEVLIGRQFLVPELHVVRQQKHEKKSEYSQSDISSKYKRFDI
jgi:hypothetical protein